MELESFSSTAEHWGDAIDCRCLTLTADFYSLSAQNATAMASDIIEWLSKITSDRFWVKRRIGTKSIRPNLVLQRLNEELQHRNYVFYTEEAMAISPVVYNLKSYQTYLRKNYIHGTPTLRSDVSVDYPSVWNALFMDKKADTQQIRVNIMRIFREEGRKHLGGYYMPDASMTLNILPYQNQTSRYYGTVRILFSAFGLNSQLDDMAERFRRFAGHLARTYMNLNVQVALQPVSAHKNSYMQLFGGYSHTDGSHIDANCEKTEWYPSYYLPSVEWFNSISPLAQQHLHRSPVRENTPVFHSEETAEGSLVIRSLKPISQFDIADALEMKKWLFPALYPGMSTIPLRILFTENLAEDNMSIFPRSTWAIVPVFEEEIDILPDYLVFHSKNVTDNFDCSD